MTTRLKVLAIAACIAVLGGFILLGRVPDEIHSKAAPTPSGPAFAQAIETRPKFEAGKPAIAPSLPGIAPSLAAQVAGLISVGKPADAFAAWQILFRCKSMRTAVREARQNVLDAQTEVRAKELADGTLAAREATFCGDLGDQQIAQRLALLEKAAAAGVPQAAMYLGTEGPWGDPSAMYTRWNDPAVQEWVAHVHDLTKLAATKGDAWAMMSLSGQFADGSPSTPQDLQLAAQYAAAYYKTMELQGRKTVGRPKQLLVDLAAKLTTDQAQQAIAAGEQMAVAALGNKQ